MRLPDELTAAVESLVAGHSTRELSAQAAALSTKYRSVDYPVGPVVETTADVVAYVAYRLPATFAAAHAVLSEVHRLTPGWKPQTLLDLGGGPGTVAWAATSVWPSIRKVTIVEKNPNMIGTGRRLAEDAGLQALRQARWLQADVGRIVPQEQADLVTAAYVLGELADGERDRVAEQWWSQAKELLVAIEPGTPAGYSRILRTREHLLAESATTMAPCPHDRPCPLTLGDWCHFSQRLPRSRLHRSTKETTLAYEDEKYSYVAMSRDSGLDVKSRVLRHPHKSKGMVRLALCTEHGLDRQVISRRDGEAYKRARELRWGSAIYADDTGGHPDSVT